MNVTSDIPVTDEEWEEYGQEALEWAAYVEPALDDFDDEYDYDFDLFAREEPTPEDIEAMKAYLRSTRGDV